MFVSDARYINDKDNVATDERAVMPGTDVPVRSPTVATEIDTSKPHPARMYDYYLGSG